MAPHEICQKLKFCPKDDSALDLAGAIDGLDAIQEQHMVMTTYPNQDDGSVSCSACKLSIDVIREKIKDSNPPISVIEEGMALICSIMPDKVGCKTFLDKAEEIVSMIQAGKSSEDCCVQLDVCASDKNHASPLDDVDVDVFNPLPLTTMGKELASSVDPACTFCISTAMVVQAVSRTHPRGLPSVKRSLQVGCSVLPPSVECDALVSKFEALVAYLRENTKTSLSSACREIQQCPKSSRRSSLFQDEGTEDEVVLKLTDDNEDASWTAATRERTTEIVAVE